GRQPRPSEMRRDLLVPFPKLFDMSKVRKYAPVASEWLGQAISQNEEFPNGYKFRAQSNDGLTWEGEAYTVSHKGVAYYWMGWCGEADFPGLQDEFAKFREKFKLIDLSRKGWKEFRANVIDYKGDTVNYTISDAEGYWKEAKADDMPALKEASPDLD